MNEKINKNIKLKITNAFGSIGYFFCTMQWFWVVLLYFSLLKSFALSMIAEDSANRAPVVVPPPQTPDIISGISSGPNVLIIVFSIVITLIVIAITIFVIIRMPSSIAKTSKSIVDTAAKNVTPIVLQIQHKKDTKKNRIKLTPLLVLITKITIITLPIILTFSSQLLSERLVEFSIAICVSSWLFGFSFTFFAIQYVLVRIFLIKPQDIK